MGTRSRIGVVNPSGTITSIYCHWDGYPGHQLPILTEHYNTAEKVADLIALGSLSVLGPEIGVRHAFDWDDGLALEQRLAHPYRRMCLSHFRDRGDLEEVASLDDRQDFMERCRSCDAEWFYLFDGKTWEYGQP